MRVNLARLAKPLNQIRTKTNKLTSSVIGMMVAVSLVLSSVASSIIPHANAAGLANKTLVYGQADNGFEGNNLATTLTGLGYSVDRMPRLPEDLSVYNSIWYIEAYQGMAEGEEARLENYIATGGSVYLTGERPCCEVLNDSVENVLHAVLKDTDIQIGGRGDINGPFTFNPNALGSVSTFPNLLVDFLPDSPGAIGNIDGVNFQNVLATTGTETVGGVWNESDMLSGKGRAVVLMDIDWLGNDERSRVVENIQNFLQFGLACADGGHWDGFHWASSSPANCSALLAPTDSTWTATSDAGPVQMSVTSTKAMPTCDYTVGPGSMTSLKCGLTSSQDGATIVVTATDGKGTTQRRYTVRNKNDIRNVPIPYSPSSDWWIWPDTDLDGLPDKWENDGVWVKDQYLDLKALGANPNHKDFFIHYDFQQGEELSEGVFDIMRKTYADAPLTNPDGNNGVLLHIERGASIPESIVGDYQLNPSSIYKVTTYSGFSASAEAGGRGVPQIYKHILNFDEYKENGKPTSTIGMAFIKGDYGLTALSGWAENEFINALGVNKWAGGATDFVRATNATHEVGHLLGLDHHGAEATPVKDDDYKSVMSYTYSTVGVPTGLFGAKKKNDYSRDNKVNLDWKLGKGVGSLTFIPGQYGEKPDFYALSNNEKINVDPSQLPVEPTTQELLNSINPADFKNFAEDEAVEYVSAFPTVQPVAAETVTGRPVTVALQGSDPASKPLTYQVVTGPANGQATIADGKVTYTSKAGFVGADTLTYKASNGTLGSSVATVTIAVGAATPVPIPTPTPTPTPAPTPTPVPISGVTINGGNDFTNDNHVKVKLVSPFKAAWMRVSDKPFAKDAKQPKWDFFCTTSSLNLTGSEGYKTVYAQFRDDKGKVSDVYIDTIMLDKKKPELSSIKINNGALMITNPLVTVQLSATDNISSVAEMQVGNGSLSGAKWQPYSSKFSWQLPPKAGKLPVVREIQVRLRDKAGNETQVYKVKVILY